MVNRAEQQHLATIFKALAFSARKHRDQRRKDPAASPYINHPIALAEVLSCEADIIDVEIVCSALLHDTVEDTETTQAELAQIFGERISRIVMEVTDDFSQSKAKRKRLQIEHAAHISDQAKLVKLADKICNLRDVAECPPPEWSLQRRREYFDWAKQVIDQLRGIDKKLEAIFDEVYARRP
ncbi:MAG: HD domain-containing protein [Candidatus Polarisedimenticolaceae bacterium]|nr:HD domain-containing protein [Candidatus Polarisedimenticolaceae bacterium]